MTSQIVYVILKIKKLDCSEQEIGVCETLFGCFGLFAC